MYGMRCGAASAGRIAFLLLTPLLDLENVFNTASSPLKEQTVLGPGHDQFAF